VQNARITLKMLGRNVRRLHFAGCSFVNVQVQANGIFPAADETMP